ncbi:DUF6090 family protein [Lutibacter sp. Hel_I_33_5]|uniref:DUF6090 family protein n=1 Tax=Lutibacter sp. Hel_I_33_5 TaxID=1566289 RepID=UPI0011A9C0CC|nr:DUF6090 family protein [Lutibacter sp. Hel_I_33_5]
MTENKFSNYFLYAFGEIVLVVIGILIALQINNWNEKNTEKNINKIYLESLVSELVSNTQLLRASLFQTQKDMKISNYYLTYFNQKNTEKVKDSSITNMIQGLGNILTYNPTQSTIDDLINSGSLKSLKNEELKKRILEIKFVYEGYKQLAAEYRKNTDSHLFPYLIKHANTTKITDSLSFLKIPKISTNSSKKAFVNNNKFNNILFTLQVVNTRNEHQFKSWIKYLNDLTRDIEKHLKDD